MRLADASASLGSISPANAPATTFNEPRLAMFGGDPAPWWFALTFWSRSCRRSVARFARFRQWLPSYHLAHRLSIGGLNLVGVLEFFDECFEAFSKAFVIEIQRVVVAVRDIGV